MGLFDKLFGKKEQKIQQDLPSYHIELHQVIIDWFNESNVDIKEFENVFFKETVDAYKSQNEWLKEKLENDEKALIDMKLYSSIIYLVYYDQRDNYIEKVLNYFLNTDNQSHTIKSYLSNSDSRMFRENESLRDITFVSKILLKLYHALYINKDVNFSYLSSITATISSMKYHSENQFQIIFNFIKQLKSNKKPFLLFSFLSIKEVNYQTGELLAESKFQLEIEKECIKSIQEYNKDNQYKLNFEMYLNFLDSVVNRTQTELWKETNYKKQKFLKPNDFEKINTFINTNSDNSNEILTHFIYHFQDHYIAHPRFCKQFLDIIIKKSNVDVDWFNFILKTKKNDNFYIANIFIPLFEKHLSQISYNSSSRIDFEQKLFFSHTEKPLDKGVNILRELCEENESKDQKELSLLKYNDVYVVLNEPYYYKSLILDKKHTVYRKLIIDLNVLFPIALKNVNKRYDYETELIGEMLINLDGKDLKIYWDNINELLQSKGEGFQLVPIPISKKIRYGTDYMEYICSLTLLNKTQFTNLVINYIPQSFSDFDTETAFKDISFVSDEIKTFNDLKEMNKSIVDDTFSSNQNWKWFRDKYIDSLSNKEKWYKLMDIILDNKGNKKPAKLWSSRIKGEVINHGENNFFSELNVLINSSRKEAFWFFEDNKQVLKAFIWIIQLFPTQNSLLILKNIIEFSYTKKPGIGPRSAVIGNIGLKVLVEINSSDSFGILNILRNKTKYQRFINAINKHLNLFKENSDEPLELLADKSIPSFGFENGVKTLKYQYFEVRFFFKGQKLSKQWIFNDKISTSIPKEIKGKYKEIEKEISEEFKSINSVFKSVKNRIRSYWINDRTWTYGQWKSFILNNELINPWIQNLVWLNETNGEAYIIMNNDLLSVNNEKIAPKNNDIISLWHPVTSNNNEIREWQKFVIDNKVNQQERQVFREFYPFSKNELSLNESPRFNDHFLSVNKLMAIANSVGWIFTYVHEDVNWPRIYLKSMNLTAHLKCDYNRNDYAIPTNGLLFTSGNTTEISYNSKLDNIIFEDIPLKLLSEVCRDIDLFISTTSIANDVDLVKNNAILGHYRNDYNYGAFSENASSKIRKTIIEAVYEKIGLNKVEFEGNFLIVKGSLNSYRINLGSGYVQTKDTREHINILGINNKAKNKIVPIKDDETLNIILAKAILLQNDSDIKNVELLEKIKKL